MNPLTHANLVASVLKTSTPRHTSPANPTELTLEKNPLERENPMSTMSTTEPTEIWGWVDRKWLYQALVHHNHGAMRHKKRNPEPQQVDPWTNYKPLLSLHKLLLSATKPVDHNHRVHVDQHQGISWTIVRAEECPHTGPKQNNTAFKRSKP